MLEGKKLILATKKYAVENKSRSWYNLLTTLILMVAVFTAIFVLQNIVARLILSIIAGLMVVRMFVIYHDHQHHAILHRSKAADFIMTIFGVWVLAPSSIWKRSHDYHHAHNSKLFSASIGSYPIATKEKYMAMSPSEKRAYLAVRHPLTIALGYFSMFIFGMCINSFTSAPKKHWDSLVALLVHASLTAIVIIFAGWQTWIFAMLVPYMIACSIGAYLFYAQHNFPTTTFNEKNDWRYDKAALESSSYMKMNPLMQWFTANIGYHHIHHLNAKIPFYKLPEVMAEMPELQHPKTTSLKISDIIACFKLKVWDPEQNKMIGVKELEATLSPAKA